MDVDRSKNHATAVQLCKTADSLLESKQIDVSLDYYTLGLLYSPAIYKKELSTDDNEEHPLALLYFNRSLAMYRLKRYQNCIDDVKRAFANGKHDDSRCLGLLSRLAWCYWHLKEYKNCAKVLENVKSIPNSASKELDVLSSLVEKSKVNLNGDKSQKQHGNSEENASFDSSLCGGEHKLLKGISSHAVWNNEPLKGRFLTTSATIKPGSVMIEEEPFCGILTPEFTISNCNYCFKKCSDHGISCCGCATALYCNEQCRLLAWRAYHWLECCMWPVLEKVDTFAHLSLRVLLCAAYKMNELDAEESQNCFTSIAQYLNSVFDVPQNQTQGKRKNLKKVAKNRSGLKLDGRNPSTGVYKQNYWSVFCLQTHENDHTKIVLTKFTLYANFLAKVLSQLPISQLRKQQKASAAVTNTTTLNLKNTFRKLGLNSLCDESNDGNVIHQDMETFRERTLETCKSMAGDAPVPKLKPQSCFNAKGLPRSFQEMLAFLLRRHMLQLQTNCQAVFDIVDENPRSKKHVFTMSQQRIASAIFPSTSLLNHSCNSNTIVGFSGRRIQVRAIHSIPESGEITHCYGPCMSRHSFRDRQKILKEQYFFDCSCTTCAKHKAGDLEEQIFLQQFTAYKCSVCSAPILILDNKGLGESSLLGKCANEACKRPCDLADLQATYNSIVSSSNNVVQRLIKQFNEDDLKALESCLEQLKNILYHHHHAIGNLHDQLAYYYSRKLDYKTAAKHVIASLKITSMRFGSESVEALQEMFKLATIYFNGGMKQEAAKYLKKTLEINKKTSVLDKSEAMRAEAMLLTLESFFAAK